MKKGLLFLSTLLLVFGIIACDQVTTTVPTTTTTGSTTNAITTATTAFSISLSGLTDAGFEEPKIYANQLFNLLEGVHAYGSDGVDYADRILAQADDDACQIDDDYNLMSTGAKTCVVTYTVVVNSKMARETRNIKISAAPVTIEFTETTLINNETWLGTDWTAPELATWDGAVNTWHYWKSSDAVFGTTGGVKLENDKLIIIQEDLGGVNYGLQTMMVTDVAIEKGRTYKITFTLTSTSDRYIDIVTKAPNNNYGLDTHSIIEVMTGTFDYEMIFVANQDILHMNIMTGVVESSVNAGTLEFSNFKLWEGPIVIEYEELPDFFTNDEIAVGTMIDYITTTDADYVREFYYWDQSSGALMSGEIVDDGIEVIVLTQAANDYGIQLQWNDMNKSGTKLIKDAYYKLTFNVNSPVARILVVNITGSANALPVSKTQSFDLVVGDNAIVVEFTSLYDYFFMKIMLGNYGDLVQTGTFTFTNLQLWQDVNAEDTEEPVDPSVIIGNVFGTVANVNDTALGVESLDLGENYVTHEIVEIPTDTFYLWYGIAATGWFAWAEYPTLTSRYIDKGVNLDIEAAGTEFWSIQLKYKGTGALVKDVDYLFSFVVYAENARRINVQLKDAGFAAAYIDANIDLVAGYNLVEIPFKGTDVNTFNMQMNLGTFTPDSGEEGALELRNFVISRPTQEVEGYVDNGDFATDAAFVAADAIGWALWTSEGVTDAWGLPNYIGTTVMAGGVITNTTTQTGGAIWACQIQYNSEIADMTVGAVYRIELDINSNVATQIAIELKNADNGLNQDTFVDLIAGDNHITLFYVASQEQFRLFIMPGLVAPGTILVIDNIKYFEPIIPETPVDPEEPVINYWPVEGGIQNGDFNAEGFGVNVEGSGWTSWTTMGAAWATHQLDATFTVTDGAVVANILGTGGQVWYIQLCYRPTDVLLNVTPGHTYRVEFDVNATVAGTFSMEMTTTDNVANVAIPVTLVVGANHVVVEYVAYEANFKLTACLGLYGIAALTFDNFQIYEAVPFEFTPIADGIQNGDFNEVGFGVNVEGSGWTSWTTMGAAWATHQLDATFTITDGAIVADILGTGGQVWYIQLCYRPTDVLLNVTPGLTYRVEFDVFATVAGTFSMEMTTTDNVANVAIPVTLVVGANHVVVEYVAYEANFKLTACLGLYGLATLTFDNFEISLLAPRA